MLIEHNKVTIEQWRTKLFSVCQNTAAFFPSSKTKWETRIVPLWAIWLIWSAANSCRETYVCNKVKKTNILNILHCYFYQFFITSHQLHTSASSSCVPEPWMDVKNWSQKTFVLGCRVRDRQADIVDMDTLLWMESYAHWCSVMAGNLKALDQYILIAGYGG